MSELNNLGQDGAPEELFLTYELLEDLPEPIRRAVQFGPYDYAVKPVWELWVQYRCAYENEQIAQVIVAKYLDDRRREAFRLYGAAHPQAQG